jgi:hypothetical protein
MANVASIRLVFNGQRSSVDPVQHHIQRDPKILQRFKFYRRFDVNRIHDHLHTTHIPGILDTRQNGMCNYS